MAALTEGKADRGAVALTETAIARAIREAKSTSRRGEITDPELPGLRLRLGASGAATWVLGCRDSEGRARRFRLGSYPAMGLRSARIAARTLREKVREGADPIGEARTKRRAASDARVGVNTLAALIDLYGHQGPGAELKSWAEMVRHMRHVLGPFMDRSTATLTPGDLQMHVDGYAAKQSAAAAVRYLRPILKWAAAPTRSYVQPALASIVPPATVKKRDRVLSHAELRAILPVLWSSNSPYRAALLFMLFTVARRDEVCSATWGDIDLGAAEWRIPETKNGTAHRIPLSRQALTLLEKLPQGAANDLVFATASGKPLGNIDRETKRVWVASGTSGWQRHDLRRTGATLMGELGVDPHVIEAALNHAAIHSALAALYNRARYLPQVRQALQMLGDRLEGFMLGGADIVPMNDRMIHHR